MACLAVVVIAFTLVTGFAASRWLFAGYRSGTMPCGGMRREYGYYLPAGYDPGRKNPLLVVLHEAGMNGRFEAAFTAADLRPRADATASILIYPSAVEGLWNDGTDASDASIARVDDAGFIFQLIDEFVRRFNGDPDRVYVLGTAEGGLMAFRLACEHPEKLTGVAALLASMSPETARRCASAMPLPVVLANGTIDEVVRWESGTQPPAGDSTRAAFVSAEENLAYWTNRNRTFTGPVVTVFPDRDPRDGSTVTRYEYTGAAAVAFLKLDGAGHSVPTTHRRLWVGVGTNRDIDGLPMAMDFLLQFRRVGDRFVRIM